GKLTAKIEAAADARIGEHTVRVITNSGVSDVRLLYVVPFQMVQEVKDDRKIPPTPQPVAMNTTVYGTTPDDDQDCYEVECKKGQRLAVEVMGARLHTQNLYDPYLMIKKADGTILAEVDDTAFSRQDPVASIVVPEDGKYHILIRESTNSGVGQC